MIPADMSRSLFRIFLFSLAPLISLVYLVLSQDPIIGTARDFGVFWTAGSMAAHGEAAKIFDPAAFRQVMTGLVGVQSENLPFLYPPHSVLFFLPLSIVTPTTALVLWLLATFGILATLLWREVARPSESMIALLLSPASIINIACGQNAYLSTGLLAGALLMIERRPVIAGILLGLLSYKPQFGIAIPFLLLAGRHWQTFIAASITTIGLVVMSLLLFGSESWLLYLKAAGGHLDFIRQWGFTSYTFYMALSLYGLTLWQAALIHAGLALLVVAAVIWAWRQNAPHALKCSVALVGVVSVAPYLLPYDMLIIAVAILLALPSFAAARWEKVFFALLWILPAFAFRPEAPLGPCLIGILFLILVRQVERCTRARPQDIDPQRREGTI